MGQASSRTNTMELSFSAEWNIDVVVSAPRLRPQRRNPRSRRPVKVLSHNAGRKRQRVSAATNVSPETGEGSSSLQSNKAAKTSKEPAEVAPKEPIFDCPVCWNNLEEPATTMCGHIFCTNCIKQAIQVQKKCPTCRADLKMDNFHRIYLPDTSS